MGKYDYDHQTVSRFIISAIVWAVIGIVLGLWISIQLFAPGFNIEPYFQFGRMRPAHTNVLAFGLGGGAIFAAFYYMVMRLTRRPLVFPKLARFHLYFFNLGMVLIIVTLFMGMNQSNEYAELEWPIDIAIVIMWVIFAINIFATIIKREEPHMYVALWYIIATLLAIAILYIINNLSIPVSWDKSYHLFAGSNSANVQWWYGHNIVGFFFTTPLLAMFYYFLPKSSGLPIYSHRLSIVAFWSLIFGYLWSGAHHLVYSPIPDWIQSFAIAITLFLMAPSWGSVVNGYMTVHQDWSRMNTQYLTKFFLLGITFYGLQTIQGPTQAIREISQLVHFTDYIPGHVHMGTMGWVTLVATAAIYYMVSKMYRVPIYSVRLANFHFWFAVIGQLTYNISMWIGGIRQGILWKSVNEDGTLAYSFMDTFIQNFPYWYVRTIGGVIFTIGMLFFVWNIIQTMRKGKIIESEARSAGLLPANA